jgi:hypothetical protein
MACQSSKEYAMMPSWLPHVVNVNGVWERVLVTLYNIFQADFIQSQPKFDERLIIWDERKIDGLYEEGFWHLITKNDPSTGDRYPDFPRASKLPWCAPTIRHANDPEVQTWDYQEGTGRLRSYLWLKAWDYVVILEKRDTSRGAVAFLVTAYHVEGASSRSKLQRKWDNRMI